MRPTAQGPDATLLHLLYDLQANLASSAVTVPLAATLATLGTLLIAVAISLYVYRRHSASRTSSLALSELSASGLMRYRPDLIQLSEGEARLFLASRT